jgi:hypothetical protein
MKKKKRTRTRRGLGGTPDKHHSQARGHLTSVMHAPTCRIGWESLGAARAHIFEASGQGDLTPLFARASKRMEELCAGQPENTRLGRR